MSGSSGSSTTTAIAKPLLEIWCQSYWKNDSQGAYEEGGGGGPRRRRLQGLILSMFHQQPFFLPWRACRWSTIAKPPLNLLTLERTVAQVDAFGRIDWPLWTRGNRIQSTTYSTIQWKDKQEDNEMLITIWRFRVNSGPTYTATPALLALPIEERFWSVWWIEAGVKAAITTITK